MATLLATSRGQHFAAERMFDHCAAPQMVSKTHEPEQTVCTIVAKPEEDRNSCLGSPRLYLLRHELAAQLRFSVQSRPASEASVPAYPAAFVITL